MALRGFLVVAALIGLIGCAAIAPLAETERARVLAVAPVEARFAPNVEFNVPPGRAGGAARTGAVTVVSGAQLCLQPLLLAVPPYSLSCLALFAGTGALVGAVGTPSNEGIEPMVERVRAHLGAPDVQQLLAQRFSERVARLTPHKIVPGAETLGPQSHADTPSYSGAVAGEGMLIAEVAVESVGATLVEPFDLFGAEYADRPLRVSVGGRIRLVRPSDGATLMTRHYVVARYAGRIQEYEHDGAKLLQTVAGAVEELATRLVDDAFLLRSDTATFGATAPAVTALEPLPSGLCPEALTYHCWGFNRVPTLDTLSPTFRWKPFPEPADLEAAPWLRAARNRLYDLWIFGGDDDRVVEGLTATEHSLERPLTACRRYSWAVRARFDTDAGPRTVEWSSSSAFPRTQLEMGRERPTFGAPIITACPAKVGGLGSSTDKP